MNGPRSSTLARLRTRNTSGGAPSGRSLSRRKKSFGAFALLATATLVIANPLSASADTSQAFDNHYSSDGGAELVGGCSYVDWQDAEDYTLKTCLKDVAADGKGPILIVRTDNSSGQQITSEAYYHNLSGYGTTQTNTGSVTTYQAWGTQAISYLQILLCNGGSESSPQNCTVWTHGDPYS